jgi:hypothetical protein
MMNVIETCMYPESMSENKIEDKKYKKAKQSKMIYKILCESDSTNGPYPRWLRSFMSYNSFPTPVRSFNSSMYKNKTLNEYENQS